MLRSSASLGLRLGLAALAVGPSVLALPVPSGSEFQVNTYTTDSQANPAVGCAGNGDFGVAWASALQDGAANGIFAQRFDGAAAPQGAEFQVNSYTSSVQSSPDVALDGAGDFVVVWRSLGQDGSYSGVFAQRFDSSGADQGAEFQVNSHTTFAQNNPAVASDGDGDFVVVWHSGAQDGVNAIGYNYGVFARRFDAAGTAQAVELQINSYTTDSQHEATVAMDSDGDFVVAWQSYGQDGSGLGIFAQRFNAAGVPQAAEFQVNTYTTAAQGDPAVAMASDGDFVIAWESNGQDGSLFGVFARRFDSSGAPQGGEFQVNSYVPYSQRSPAIAMDQDGDFVVTWHGSFGGSYHVLGQAFDASGVAHGDEFMISTNAMSYSSTVCSNVVGDFVVAWHGVGNQDGASEGIFGRLFEAGAGPILDIDADGSLGPLTDGLLVLRSFFGFTGTALVTGAVGGGCTRCTAGDVEAYIGSIAISQLDVDGDGEVEPLTDGLLILRYLFGFTGATLVAGAVDLAECTRCTAEAITAYLDGLAS